MYFYCKHAAAQQCLVKYLEHLLEFFEKTGNLSEDKTYAMLRKICQKIQVHFPYFKAITNITHKLIANVRLKVDDVLSYNIKEIRRNFSLGNFAPLQISR